MNIKCQCPYCNQPLEAESNMLGLVVDCPGCSTKIVVAKGSASPSSVKIHKTDSDDTEPATEKQIAFITRLGGNPSRSLRKFQASRLIEELLSVAPATKYQLEYLKKNGIPIPCDITANRAKEIKAKVEGDKPPSKSLIESLAELGVSIPPKTMRESEDLYDTLINTSMATERQKLEAIRLGGNLPEGLTYLQANKYISDLEQDRDPKDGKPPTKAQLNQIRKLGGSIDKAINNWRAEAYIEELEELKEEEEDEFNERIENAYDLGTDLDAGKWNLPVKRPSKAVMKKAIQYGIDQGWGPDWDDGGMDNKYNPYSLIGYAIYCVAPELLKPNREPPQMPLLYAIEKKRNEEALKMLKEKLKEKKKEERKGCLLLIIFLLSILFIAAIKIKLLF